MRTCTSRPAIPLPTPRMTATAAAIACVLASDPAEAALRAVSTSSELSEALQAAQPGDEIVLRDGIYYGQFDITQSSGTADAPIKLRAEHPHKAILEWQASCNWGDAGIYINQSYWTIEGLRMRRQSWGVFIEGAHHVTLRDMIIEDYHGNAVAIYNGSNNNTVENSVIGHTDPSCAGANNIEDVGVFVWKSFANTLRNNIVLATGDNGYQAGNKRGIGLYVADEDYSGGAGSHDNVLQGNLLLMNGGKAILRLLNATNSTVQDNAVLWGEGGGLSTDHCSDDYNTFINNIAYGCYHSAFNTKGNDTGSRGHHVWRHNLIVTTPFSRTGGAFQVNSGNCGGTKYDMTLADNIVMSEGELGNSMSLLAANDSAKQFPGADNNLFWAPGPISSWTSNYAYGPNDIKASPQFTNAAEGDFTLASESAGKNAASDGRDVGIEYNEHLKKAWIRNAFTLETQQKSVTGQTASFTVDPTHYYGVWYRIPAAPCGAVETFDVEGEERVRDMTAGGLDDPTWIQTDGGPSRWITLGREIAPDGVLDISFTNAACADAFFIRRIPTVEEAYAWIQGGGGSAPPAAPTNLRVE